MHKTMNLDSLSTGIFGSFFSYIQKNVNEISKKTCYVPKSKLVTKQQIAEE